MSLLLYHRGLGSLRSRYFLLRDELHFRPSVYYAAVFVDFLARLGWALVISPQQPYLQQHFILLLAAVEISRRCMWAVLRVEWEFVKSLRNGSTALRSAAVPATGSVVHNSSGDFYVSPSGSAERPESPGASSDKFYGADPS